MSKFSRVPLDEYTTILGQETAKLGQYDVLHQVWSWDGVTAESYIFCNDDVAEMDDDEIKHIVAQSPRVKSENDNINLTRSDSGYTFVNFNANLSD